MPFQKNDPKTRQAAVKGGNTGTKHLETMPKEKLKKLSTKAGKISGQKRREIKEAKDRLALDKRATKYQDRIMKKYLI